MYVHYGQVDVSPAVGWQALAHGNMIIVAENMSRLRCHGVLLMEEGVIRFNAIEVQ